MVWEYKINLYRITQELILKFGSYNITEPVPLARKLIYEGNNKKANSKQIWKSIIAYQDSFYSLNLYTFSVSSVYVIGTKIYFLEI